MYNTLKALLPATPSVSGRESGVRAVIEEMMKPLVDEIRTDAMGNLICVKRGCGESPRAVMLCAHMDEIGFIVNFIEDNGYLRVAPVGGIHYAAAMYAKNNSMKGII